MSRVLLLTLTLGVVLAATAAENSNSAFVKPTFSSKNKRICSEFGHNWAAEIRCLRQHLDSCLSNVAEDYDDVGYSATASRGLRSLVGMYPQNQQPRRTYSGYPSGHFLSPQEVRQQQVFSNPRHQQIVAVEQKEYCNCSGLETKFEKKLYQSKMAAEFKCDTRIDEVKQKLELDLAAYQKMTDKDLKEITRKLDVVMAPKRYFNGFEYVFFERFESWYTAEEYCIGWGGHLASIHSQAENQVVKSLVPKTKTAWISLNDVQKENIFVNTDKTTSEFRNWKEGQPDNGLHNENCIEVDENGEWSDLLCLVTRQFICKKSQNY